MDMGKIIHYLGESPALSYEDKAKLIQLENQVHFLEHETGNDLAIFFEVWKWRDLVMNQDKKDELDKLREGARNFVLTNEDKRKLWGLDNLKIEDSSTSTNY